MAAEHVDVLIVGAGLSGVGAACQLRRRCPDKTVAILESRDAIGGTWDLFRYPGVRSDSDMFTLGYSFRPWTEPKALADADAIRTYVRDTATAYGVDRQVRFNHRVVAADWSSADARWTVRAQRTDPAEGAGTSTDPADNSGADSGQADAAATVEFTCSFLFVCSGYYRYDQGYTPPLPGLDRYTGQVVHPQHWPDEMEYAGRQVVVVGSGATAVTLVPAMAEHAAHVTMVQRSPSYVLSRPARDAVADTLRRRLPMPVAYQLVRAKNILLATALFQFSRRVPSVMKRLLRRGARRRLPAGYDVDTHFGPYYDPWDQRLCLVPDGDLFAAIQAGRASVLTDRIDTFTERGLRLASGTELAADLVVTATGLNLLPIGGMTLTVDGDPVDLAGTVAYKGMMLSGVPNFALTLGYTNASWTLKADLVSGYVCRLLKHMDRYGYRICTPLAPTAGGTEPIIDLKAGYVLRSLAELPRQGASAPWRLHQNYVRDALLFRYGRIEDEGVRFTGPVSARG